MGSGHKTLLYGNAILLRHSNSNMVRKYSALHRNSPFTRFMKSDDALAWLNIKFSSMAHLKQLSANFHLKIQKSQKSQGY